MTIWIGVCVSSGVDGHSAHGKGLTINHPLVDLVECALALSHESDVCQAVLLRVKHGNDQQGDPKGG